LNTSSKLKEGANIFEKFVHWMKDVHIKSSEEVFSNTAKTLKEQGKIITDSDKKIITNEIKRAKNLRSACQVANLGVSLILLGLIIPIWTRSSTKKKHAEDLKRAEELSLKTGTEKGNVNYSQVA
jgi:hypothetical protein